MKSKVNIPNWDELNEIFDRNDFKLNHKVLEQLNGLGYRTHQSKGKHPKLYIVVDGKTHVITMSVTPSKQYQGRVILRTIRKIYEQD